MELEAKQQFRRYYLQTSNSAIDFGGYSLFVHVKTTPVRVQDLVEIVHIYEECPVLSGI